MSLDVFVPVIYHVAVDITHCAVSLHCCPDALLNPG